MFRSLLSLLFIIFSFQMSAQFGPMTKFPSPDVDTLHSDIMNEDYYLHITLPPLYDFEKKDYPVLYYLDAYSSAGTVNDIAIAAMGVKEIESVILVGISYRVSPMFWQQKRQRDYLPPVSAEDTKHRADDFIQFLGEELMPFIGEKYRTDSSVKGLLGCSYGGLLTAWTVKEAPGLFNRLAAISPSLWYNDASFLSDSEVEENIAQIDDLRVFTSAGSLEHESMIINTEKFEDKFSMNENIELSRVVFEGENHGTVALPSIQRAILFLFRNEYKHLIKQADEEYYAGNYTAARDKMLEANQLYPARITTGVKYNLACVYALTGDKDNSFKLLNEVVKTNYSNIDHISNDKDFLPLHGDDRWKEVLDRVADNKKRKEKK